MPYINKILFLNDAQKIVPSLTKEQFTYAKGFGGIRPQVINKDDEKLMLGEAAIHTGEGIIFNMTPSPGATSCLGNAERDLRFVTAYLGKSFDEERFKNELTEGEYCALPEPIETQKENVNRIRDAIRKTYEEYYIDHIEGEPAEDFWNQPHSKI